MATRKRRGPGEGSIYQRKDGRWEVTLLKGYRPDGKRDKQRAIARTYAEAAQRLAQMKRDHAAGLEPEAEAWTVADWLTRWLDTIAPRELRERTLQTYRASVRLHVSPALGHHPLRKLRAEHIEAYMRARLAPVPPAKPAAAQTVKNEVVILGRALQVATMRGYVERNVARLTSSPKVRREKAKPLTPEETRQFLDTAKGHRSEALFVLAASTGLRRGEVLGLTWEAVDLDNAAIRVTRTLSRYDREFHLGEPKTETSHRTIAIPDQVVATLRRHRARQAEERLGAAVWLNRWGLVFTTEVGAPIEARSLYDEFTALLDRAKVRRVRFHDLRHGAASFLFAAGASMKEVQETLGHSDIRITMDTYTHLGEEMRRGIADKMSAALFDTGT